MTIPAQLNAAMIYIITILLTILGITDRFHVVLQTTLENARIRHKLPPPSLMQWLFIICIFIFLDFQIRSSLHWVFLAAYAGLEVYGIFTRRIPGHKRAVFLCEEQMTTLGLFILAFLVDVIRY
jgi:hypothetical protein